MVVFEVWALGFDINYNVNDYSKLLITLEDQEAAVEYAMILASEDPEILVPADMGAIEIRVEAVNEREEVELIYSKIVKK